jgi:hypothetical protein
MGHLRTLRKFVLILLLVVSGPVVLTIASGHIEQHIFRRRAEQLLYEVQEIELRTTSWEKALKRSAHWDVNRATNKSCDAHQCSFEIILNEFVFAYLSQRTVFDRLDDYFRWRFKLSYDRGPFVRAEDWLLYLYMRAGGRPSKVVARVGMRDGTVWRKDLTVTIYTPTRFEWFTNEPSGFVLVATVNGVPRMDYFGEPWVSSQLLLHPDYEIGRPGGCEGCVSGWVKFTPYADPLDVQRLMQLNLSCLTRWNPCTSQSDIMPSAWSQYVAENSQTDSRPSCLSAIVKLFGRDSANAATAEVVRYREDLHSDTMIAAVRVIERLKGMRDWKAGDTHTVSLEHGRYCVAENVRVGSKLILYGGLDRSAEANSSAGQFWPVMPLTDNNLNLFRLGISRDYSATDSTEPHSPW